MIMEAEKDENRLSREHAVTIKRLELEVLKLETKWNSWLKIPITIIKLPIYIILSFGFIAAVLRKQEPSKDFWAYLK